MSELPEGWISVALAEAVAPEAPIQYGILQPGPDTPKGVPYVRPTEIRHDRIDVAALRRTTPQIAEKYRRSSLKAGDVLLSIVGTIGKVAIVPPMLEGANITQSSARIRPRDGLVSTSLMAWFLRSPLAREQFDGVELGTGVPRLNIGDIRKFAIPIPPLAEQPRVVAKVEEHLVHVNAARENLSRVPAIFRRFRQSVLAAAFSGRLTEQWQERPGREDAWTETTVGEVADLISGAGFPIALQGKVGLQYPFFKVGSLAGVESGAELESSPDTVNGEIARELRARVIPIGSVLFAKIGMAIRLNRRRLAGVQCCIDNNLMAAIPKPGIRSRFLLRFLETVDLLPLTQATTVPSLRKGDVQEIPISVPSLAEQDEIVRRIEALFALADAIEERVAVATARAEKLTQAILAKAFRGELVPTEAELARREGRAYEPAAAMLRRVRSNRAVSKATKSGLDSRNN